MRGTDRNVVGRHLQNLSRYGLNLDIVAGLIKRDLRSGQQQCHFAPVAAAARAFAGTMLALFTKSWRRKAAIVALVFYALGIAAPAAAFALTDAGALCLTGPEANHAAGSHHVRDAQTATDHASHSAPAANDHGMTGKCCGTFCFTALTPHVAPIAAPLMQVAALSQLRVLHLLGHGSDPIDRPPRSLLSI